MSELQIAPCPVHGERCKGDMERLQLGKIVSFRSVYPCGVCGEYKSTPFEAAATFAHCQQKPEEPLKPAEAETELERMAWELYKSLNAGWNGITQHPAVVPQMAFDYAKDFLLERQRRRGEK